MDRDLIAASGRLRADRLHDFARAGFASRARRMEPDSGRTSRRAFAGVAHLRGAWRGRRRRRARDRFVEGQRIGRRNSVRHRARSAAEGQRAGGDYKPRFPKFRRPASPARRARDRDAAPGGRTCRSTRPGNGNRATISMRPALSLVRTWRGARSIPACGAH